MWFCRQQRNLRPAVLLNEAANIGIPKLPGRCRIGNKQPDAQNKDSHHRRTRVHGSKTTFGDYKGKGEIIK